MLTANWGRVERDPVSKFLQVGDEPLVDELKLSYRVVNALRGNYHDWCHGHWEKEYPPVSWLAAMTRRTRRNLIGIGSKALAELEAVCPSRDRRG